MSKRPITVQAAAALEAAEGLVATGIGVYVGVQTAIGAAVDPASAIGTTVLALAGGLGMLACARGLLRAEQWSRAPTVLTQLFALPIAWSLWQSDRLALAVPLGLVAVLALVAVLSSPSTAWLLGDHDDDRDGRDEGDGKTDAKADAKADEKDAGGRDGDGGGTGDAADGEAPPGEPRSLGRRLMDRLKVQPTRR